MSNKIYPIGIQNFEKIRQDGYFFDIELIERFLLSIKAKKFVIFSGNSGNGKTALAMEYG